MTGLIELKSPDGHRFAGYRSDPAGDSASCSRAGVVVLQEIFGVNRHIRSVCDRLAGLGYVALAPALFDRQLRGFESAYSPADVEFARTLPPRMNWDEMILDVQTAIDALDVGGAVGVIGFCMGGSLAYFAATRLTGLVCAVAYYGSKIKEHVDEVPRVPVLMHFGESDKYISQADVQEIRSKRPDCLVHMYSAGHGFNCDERASFDADCAALAWQRTLAWLPRLTPCARI